MTRRQRSLVVVFVCSRVVSFLLASAIGNCGEPPKGHPNRAFLIELAALRGTALVVTETAISSGRFHESNPLMKHRSVRWTVGLASMPLAAFVAHKLDGDGHHKAARWFRRGALALAGADAAWDVWKTSR